jgi:hypothetical protein
MNNYKFEIGQKVVLYHSGDSGPVGVSTIERITPKGQIVLKSGSKYNQEGNRIGDDDWHKNTIEPATEENLKELKNKIYRTGLSNMNWRNKDIPDDVIAKIYIIIHPFLKKDK